MNKQIEVQIMGQSYLLGCPDDGESQLRVAVERVDAAMCKIRDAGKVKARDRIAVLASLNLAFDLVTRETQQAESAATAASSSPALAPVAAPSAGTTTATAAAATAAAFRATSPEAAATTAASDTAQAHGAGSTDSRAAQLLARLDQALAGDGHLL